jgi:hypothetical protein
LRDAVLEEDLDSLDDTSPGSKLSEQKSAGLDGLKVSSEVRKKGGRANHRVEQETMTVLDVLRELG